MKWLKQFLASLWALIKRLFGFKKQEQVSVVPQYQDTGDLNEPKQLGAGNPFLSEQRLKEISQDNSNREAVLDAQLMEAQIEGLSVELKLKERELEGKLANERAQIELERKQQAIEAERIRQEQDRLNAESQARIENERLKQESEQVRLFNKQAEANQKAKAQEKRAAREQKQSRKARNKRRKSRRWRTRKRNAWASLKSAASWLIPKVVTVVKTRWLWSTVLLLLVIVAGYFGLTTEVGSQMGWLLLGYIEEYQRYIIGTLSIVLIGLILYRLTQSAKWPGIKKFVFRKKILIPLGVVTLVFWFYKSGYLSLWFNQILVWSSQAWVFIAGLWQYKWYVVASIAVILVAWFKFGKRFAEKRKSLRKQGKKLNTFVNNLSIATRVLIAIGLSGVIMFGAYIGVVWIMLAVAGLIPVLAFSWKPGPGLVFRVLAFVAFEMLALAAFLPSAY